jgi:xanthine dehydrogenase accessory factor
MSTILVRGSGDVGAAIAHALFARGISVVLHDEPCPSHPRRAMAFTDALYEGCCELEGVLAKRARGLESLARMLECHHAVPATAEPLDAVIRLVHPEVVVDARMRKRSPVGSMLDLAGLTIGLGPGYVAGANVHLAIETAWGNSLGQVVRDGPTLPLAGEPRELAGIGRERFVYSPAQGKFETQRSIGEQVLAGEYIGCVGATAAIHSPLAGFIRGLSHSGASITLGAKILELDPRSVPGPWWGLAERPRRVAQGVVAAIAERMPF